MVLLAYESAEQAKLYQQHRNKTPKAVVERVVAYLKEKYTGDLDLAVDVGCGSGQNTFIVADYFKNVKGIDSSGEQVANGQAVCEKKNVTFEVGSAENINVPDGRVQLITAMTAAHWFDLPKFYEEGLRVLSPGGVMAIYSFYKVELSWPTNPARNEAVQKVYNALTREGELVEFAPPAMKMHIATELKTVIIPYDDFVRDDTTFAVERQLSLADIMGLVQSFGVFQLYKQAKGEEAAIALLNEFKTRLMEAVQDDLTPEQVSDPTKVIFMQRSPIVLLMARKPPS